MSLVDPAKKAAAASKALNAKPAAGAAVFDDLLKEERSFPPSPQFAQGAVVRDRSLYESATKSLEAFWENEAQTLRWSRPWSKVLE